MVRVAHHKPLLVLRDQRHQITWATVAAEEGAGAETATLDHPGAQTCREHLAMGT